MFLPSSDQTFKYISIWWIFSFKPTQNVLKLYYHSVGIGGFYGYLSISILLFPYLDEKECLVTNMYAGKIKTWF